MSIIRWLRGLFRPRPVVGVGAAERYDPEPPICTYCGGTNFYEGPSGGLSTNILCANDDCRHWFNYSMGIAPLEDLYRIEPKRWSHSE